MSRTAEPLRIQIVSTSVTGGGAEAQILLLARGLQDRGHTVSLVSLCDPEGIEPEDLVPTIEFASLGMRRGSFDPRALLGYSRLVREFAPDVVHSHMFHANLLSRIGRPLIPRPKHVSTAHNFEEESAWRNVAYRVTDPLTDVTTVVCRKCADRFVERGAVRRSRIRYLPNGIDFGALRLDRSSRGPTRSELGVGPETFLWLAAGRIEKEKDFHTLVRAVKVISGMGRSRDQRILIAGDGSMRDELMSQVQQSGLEGTISLLGFRNDVQRLMVAADGFLLSSVSEGLPMVLLEASAANLPIVATDVGGTREIVLDRETGFVVPPSDPAALASAMTDLVALSAHQRADMGKRAADHVQGTFAIEAIIDSWEEVYAGVRD